MTDKTNAAIPTPWLFRFAVFLAVCALLLLFSGRLYHQFRRASGFHGPVRIGWIGPGGGAASGSDRAKSCAAGKLRRNTHNRSRCLVDARGNEGPLRLLGGVLQSLIFALNGWVGTRGIPPLSPAIGGSHAILAHLFFSAIVMIAVFTFSGMEARTRTRGCSRAHIPARYGACDAFRRAFSKSRWVHLTATTSPECFRIWEARVGGDDFGSDRLLNCDARLCR